MLYRKMYIDNWLLQASKKQFEKEDAVLQTLTNVIVRWIT